MSKYPVWWDTTVTIYNKYTDPITQMVSWYRSVVDGCFWKYVHDKMTIRDTVLETNHTVCRIRESDSFREKGVWINLPADVKAQFFTLGQGDIIVKGDVEDTIDEYTSGHRSSDLLEKYKELQGCFEIEVAAVNVGPGRGLPHYRAQGV